MKNADINLADQTVFDKASTKSKSKKNAKKHKKGKGKARADGKKPPKKTLAQLKKEGASNAKARRRYIARLRKEYIPSAKIEKTMEILQNVVENTDREKTIIFSQFTSLLDLVEIPILQAGWGFRRYDGSMTATARNEAVEEFTDKPNCRIMLVSLKAGNAGLNLVAASQVIILDPFWNPYIEEQAIDRAHRIGQLRRVEVHRILVPDTVEDRILQLQEKKREVIEGALDEKAAQTVSRLGERELAFLFVSIQSSYQWVCQELISWNRVCLSDRADLILSTSTSRLLVFDFYPTESHTYASDPGYLPLSSHL